jgi:hypothetical protein
MNQPGDDPFFTTPFYASSALCVGMVSTLDAFHTACYVLQVGFILDESPLSTGFKSQNNELAQRQPQK